MLTVGETIDKAHELVEAAITNRECPFCESTEWARLNTYGVTTPIFSMEGSPEVPGGVEQLLEDGPDIIGLSLGQTNAVGLFCIACGFIRFHYFT